ncbi:hypothetical protein PCNPT3_09975 [Psychromonas sp. CNPT3]|uniref:DUF1107 family protein n=1 Tax=Psychromonas sp. CNPT3 TaxID=314282 RepID=UPI00006E711E|nr:DUF1107 family protein [Psychromonas sp. CNPT3]AGH81933.1 hypothetical protein PCNPT3_09975 [Psychromonas sp. CNPT3]
MNIKNSITLRSFKKYHPRQIAKFVKGFFNGRIFIVGLGRLRVIEGRVVAYQYQKKQQNILIVVSEINQIITEMSQRKQVLN